ncbi:MAG: DNA mismatch repair endonuclease MutL [Bacteroidota bacterium]
MSDIIQLLPDNVANQIAAGEVVQRPASVVKELMENAVDAGADSIRLIIKDAGRTLIQVIDNGKGMSQTDARLAFERHATSKIKTADDLYNLHTNGFRGEALASIAAISYVTLKSKQDKEELGTKIDIKGGDITTQEIISTPNGTSIEVKNLFYNIPARRNFLKSNTIETRHIIDAFQRVALTYPEISFSLLHNDSEIFKLNAGNLKQRIIGVFGKKIDEKLVPITEETEILKISGFVAKANYAKKKRGEQFYFVNDRFIKSHYLQHAVTSAFEELIPHGYHPSYFLYLHVPPQSIDINIHPTKTEIKFDNEKDLYAIIRSTIKHSLGQYNVTPVLDFEKDPNLDTPYTYKNKTTSAPKIQVDPNFNPFESEQKQGYNPKKELKPSWEALYTDKNITDDLENSIKNLQVEAENVSQDLFDENIEQTSYSTFHVHQRYILSSIKSGLVLIDQNAAHQRILYEEYLEKITVKGIGSQHLLFPKEVSLNKNDLQLVKDIHPDLESAGFQFSITENDTISVQAIPATITESMLQNIFETLADNIKNEVPDSNFSQLDSIAKSLAKSTAIKKGRKLSHKEQEDIVNNLFLCKEPNFSPTGRKTFITLTLEELEEKFNF